MNSTNSTAIARWLIVAAATFLHASAFAQDSTLDPDFSPDDAQFEQIATLLSTLDAKANACLEADPAAASQDSHCQQLIAAIDGDDLRHYLNLCAQIKSWRDRYVAEFAASALDSGIEQEQALRFLVQTEFYCGENALRERTEHVFPAFARLNQSMTARPGRVSAVGSRNSVPQATQQIHDRLQQETDRLWQELQLENLRRQLPRTNDF